MAQRQCHCEQPKYERMDARRTNTYINDTKEGRCAKQTKHARANANATNIFEGEAVARGDFRVDFGTTSIGVGISANVAALANEVLAPTCGNTSMHTVHHIRCSVVGVFALADNLGMQARGSVHRVCIVEVVEQCLWYWHSPHGTPRAKS